MTSTLRNIDAHNNQPPPGPMLRVAAMSAEADGGAGASYTPGEISVDAQVSATFDVVVP